MNELPAEYSPTLYRFRPRIIGGETVFRLMPDALDCAFPAYQRRIAYGDIVRVRLSFQPANLAARRFVTEIWPREGGKISFASVWAQSAFNFEDRSPAYRSFVLELCGRIANVQPTFCIETGMVAWRWWPAALFAVATLVAVIYWLGYSLAQRQTSLFVVSLFFGILFVWQIGNMIFRNRPRSCEINSIPETILPAK